MNIIDSLEEYTIIKKNYTLVKGEIVSIRNMTPMSLTKSGTIRLSTPKAGRKKTYDVRYILSVLSANPVSDIIVLPDDINYDLQRCQIIDKDGYESQPCNKLGTLYRLTFDGIRTRVMFHQLVHHILNRGYLHLFDDAKLPSPRVIRRPSDNNMGVKFAKHYMAQCTTVSSVYTCGISPVKYSGPIADILSHNIFFKHVKDKMITRQSLGTIDGFPTSLIVATLMRECKEDIKRQLTAWVELHKFKAKRGELNKY